MSRSSVFPPPRLTPDEAALCTAYLVHLYGVEKGRPISRFRLSRESVRVLGLRLNLREVFTMEWMEALGHYGWVAVPYGEEFLLIRQDAISGWVRLGTKRLGEILRRLRRGDRSALTEMENVLSSELPEEDEEGE